jgi:pyruvate dehydrogenase E2 component (dihydrolipoamide acetyltransferase)
MPLELFMPALSPTMEDGTLAKWLKNEGDIIKSGDVIAEIETDKATMEFESIDDGILGKILIPSGTENVLVNTVIALMLTDEETQEDLDNYNTKSNKSNSSIKLDTETLKEFSEPDSDLNKDNKSLDEPDDNQGVGIESNPNISKKIHREKIAISPLAKRLAIEKNIDYKTITGTGPYGRIIKKDIINPTAKLNDDIKNDKTNLSSSSDVVDYYSPNNYDVVPLTKMREIIASRLTKTISEIPQYSINIDCSVSSLNKIRARMNQELANQDIKLSINDFIIKASSKCLLEVPEVNSSWAGNSILKHHTADIGFAVAIEGGLITPIIRNVEIKGLKEISVESKSLISTAKERKLKPSDYEGGNFSISSLGSYGIKSFNSIVNQPQSSILSVGVAEERPVVINGALAIDNVMTVTLTSDHRVIDGAVAAKFISYFKQLIEDPSLLLL